MIRVELMWLACKLNLENWGQHITVAHLPTLDVKILTVLFRPRRLRKFFHYDSQKS